MLGMVAPIYNPHIGKTETGFGHQAIKKCDPWATWMKAIWLLQSLSLWRPWLNRALRSTHYDHYDQYSLLPEAGFIMIITTESCHGHWPLGGEVASVLTNSILQPNGVTLSSWVTCHLQRVVKANLVIFLVDAVQLVSVPGKWMLPMGAWTHPSLWFTGWELAPSP